MAPKEKAIQLVELYWKSKHQPFNYEHSKQCALIAVDEMLTWFKAHSYSNKNYDAFVFYNEVIQEIEKL